ncbi:unnamed protein product [Fusarium equiseti]|uniref:Uncharacterized protein n=1 Tax=Fusarium equiseti TaxID=61235 RepID=A0A8J2IMU5_FUSEQ|nr:unnamed protein product [Fusarium equiseti]
MSSTQPHEVPYEMNDPTAESQRQAQYREAITLLDNLETQRKQVLVQYERQTIELNRQIQHLRSEINTLRTTSSTSLESSNLAQALDHVARHASRLGLRAQDRQPKPREVEVLGHILCHPLRLTYLETFLREESRQPAGIVRARYCLAQVGTGAQFPALLFRNDGHVDCLHDGNGDNCVWIKKGENEVGWVIGSRA